MKRSERTSDPPGPLLAFGAHPDDIEFGLGGVIAIETAVGRRCHFVICSRGESASNGTPAQRVAEAKAGAKILGATVEFAALGAGSGDGRLEALPRHAIALAGIIRREKPAILLAPTPCENQHPDHMALAKLVRDAARLARYGGIRELKKLSPHAIDALLFYAITPDAEPRDMQSLLVNISDTAIVETWTRAMEAHASQMKSRNYVELQLTRVRLNGLRAGVEYATSLFVADPMVLDSLSVLKTARRF